MSLNGTKPVWAEWKEGKASARLAVAETLSGPLTLTVHAVTGRHRGPTLGITTTIHGDETIAAMIVRRLMDELDTARLSGRLCAITACNALAMAAFDRQTPEQHGRTDLHEVFPGASKGNLTQRLAHAITTGLLDHVDAHIDYHSGGSGGRLQERVDFDVAAKSDIKTRSLELARRFGTVMVHENNLVASAVRYVNGRGKPAFNAETAGTYLGPEVTEYYMAGGVKGITSVMQALGMLQGEPLPAPPQARFTTDHRVEVNPSVGGFLESFFQRPAELGTRVARGTRLGQVVDMHNLDVVEVLDAPVDGYLFFSRYSGVVDAGTKAFALAEETGIEWLR